MKNTIKEKPYEGIWSKLEPYTIYKVDLEGRHTLSQTNYNMYKFLFKDIDNNIYDIGVDYISKFDHEDYIEIKNIELYSRISQNEYSANFLFELTHVLDIGFKNISNLGKTDLFLVLVRYEYNTISSLKWELCILPDDEDLFYKAWRLKNKTDPSILFKKYNSISKEWIYLFDEYDEQKFNIIGWVNTEGVKIDLNNIEKNESFIVNLSTDALLKSSDDDTDLLSKLATMSVDENDNPVWSGEVKFEEQEIITS